MAIRGLSRGSALSRAMGDVSQFFRPKTGTLATAGRRFLKQPVRVSPTTAKIARGGQRVTRAFRKDPLQFTPLSMRESTVPMSRRAFTPTLGRQRADDIGYALRGAAQLSPFQRSGAKLRATAPTTERQRMAERVGRGIYGTALMGPKALARLPAIAGFSTAVGTALQGGRNVLTGQPLTQDLIPAAKQSLAFGLATAPTQIISGMIVNKLANTYKFLKPLSDTGISKTLPTAQMTMQEWAKNLGKTGIKRLVKAVLVETPVETVTYGITNRQDQETFKESFAREFKENLVFNSAFAGVNTAWDARTLAPVINKTVNDTLAQVSKEMGVSPKMAGQAGFLGIGKDKPLVEVKKGGRTKQLFRTGEAPKKKAGLTEVKKGGKLQKAFRLMRDESGFIKPDEFLPKLKGEQPKAKLTAGEEELQTFFKQNPELAAQLKGENLTSRQMARLATGQTKAPTLKAEQPKVEPGIQSILRAGEKASKQQATLTAKQRRAQMGRLGKAVEGKTGKDFVEAGLKAMKGKFENVKVGETQKLVEEGNVTKLFRQITESKLQNAEKIRAGRSLDQFLRDGRAPRPAELKLWRQVFGDVADDIASGPTLKDGLPSEIVDKIMNAPRALMASVDLSAAGRQGIFLIPTHPLRAVEATGSMIKQAFSENKFQENQAKIKTSPEYEIAQKSGLALTELDDLVGAREEAIRSSLPEKMPILGGIFRGSNRAYTGFLNKFRFDVFNDLYKKIDATGKMDDNAAKDLAAFINAGTGRGDYNRLPGQKIAKALIGEELGTTLNRMSPLLNAAFFSPRLVTSRINLLNPKFYVDLAPGVRKEAIKSLLGFVGTMGTILTVAKMGGAEVEGDPRNSDWGKIKIGNTRYDIMGGFQQYIRLLAQATSGISISSQTGTIKAVGEGFRAKNRREILLDFFDNKTSPIFSFFTAMLEGENAIGQKFDFPVEVARRMIPLVIQDIYDLYKEGDSLAEAIVMGSPAVFGIGTQTYGTQELKTGEDVFGRPTSQIEGTTDLAEDIVGKFRGEQPLGTTKGYNVQTYYQQLLQMNPQEAAKQIRTIKQTNPELLKKIEKEHELNVAGVTPQDRRIKLMGVANGERARFIFKEVQKLETPQEKASYVRDLKVKKVITEEVEKQLLLLFQREQ